MTNILHPSIRHAMIQIVRNNVKSDKFTENDCKEIITNTFTIIRRHALPDISMLTIYGNALNKEEIDALRLVASDVRLEEYNHVRLISDNVTYLYKNPHVRSEFGVEINVKKIMQAYRLKFGDSWLLLEKGIHFIGKNIEFFVKVFGVAFVASSAISIFKNQRSLSNNNNSNVDLNNFC